MSSSRRLSTLITQSGGTQCASGRHQPGTLCEATASSLQDGEQEAEKESGAKTYEKDNFFDSLSCEALDRLAIREAGEDARVDGRARNAAQRKVPSCFHVVISPPACWYCRMQDAVCSVWTCHVRCSSTALVSDTAVCRLLRRLCGRWGVALCSESVMFRLSVRLVCFEARTILGAGSCKCSQTQPGSRSVRR